MLLLLLNCCSCSSCGTILTLWSVDHEIIVVSYKDIYLRYLNVNTTFWRTYKYLAAAAAAAASISYDYTGNDQNNFFSVMIFMKLQSNSI